MIFRVLLGWVVAATVAAAPGESFVGSYLQRLGETSEVPAHALRHEFKIVVPDGAAQEFVSALERRFAAMAPRDRAPEGFEPMNESIYLYPAGRRLLPLVGYVDPLPEHATVPKFRIRKYALRDPVSGAVFTAPATDGLSFFELKMPHPRLEGVNLKSRLIVNDRHLDLLLDPSRFPDPAVREGIRETLMADRRNDPMMVDPLFELIEQLYEPFGWFRRAVKISYLRQSFKLELPSSQSHPVKAQITIDRDVQYQDPHNFSRLASFAPGWRAVEVKIPVWALPEEAVQEVRELQNEILLPARVPQVGLGDGKKAAFEQIAPREAARLEQRYSVRSRVAPAAGLVTTHWRAQRGANSLFSRWIRRR